MPIVATEIESVHGAGANRMIYYRCMDHAGKWHSYGPVMTSDGGFDENAHRSVVAQRVALSLEEGKLEEAR